MKKDIISIFSNNWETLAVVGSIILIMKITSAIKSDRKSFVLHEEIIDICFLVYIVLLFDLLSSSKGCSFIPFKEMFRYKYGSSGFYKQVVDNIVLFIPVGYYVSRYCKLKKLYSIMLVSLLCSASIEAIQYFSGGCVNVDDVILNIVGGIIGFLIYIGLNAIKNHLPKFLRSNWFYNLICILIIVIIILYFIGLI